MGEPEVTVNGAVPGTPAASADPMDYDALRELATHLGGVLVARERAAATPEERESWRRRRLDQRLELRRVDPFDAAAVAALRVEFAGRLRALV